MADEYGSNKEFIEEEIIKIICDSVYNVFGLRPKFENSESSTVEIILESEKDKTVANALYYNRVKSINPMPSFLLTHSPFSLPYLSPRL